MKQEDQYGYLDYFCYDLEESTYAACWFGDVTGIKVFQLSETVKEEQIKEKKEKAWDPLDLLPPLSFYFSRLIISKGPYSHYTDYFCHPSGFSWAT